MLKPKPKIGPKVQYVVALYDFSAQVFVVHFFPSIYTEFPVFFKADGDLSFKVGDRIEIVEKTRSAEDWWTGKLNGEQGVFPGMHIYSAELFQT
jgi:amphiphysin